MKKLLILSTGAAGLALAGLLFVPTFVNAQGGTGNGNGTGYGASSENGNGYERTLAVKAKILDMTTDQLKTQLQDKTMDQVIEAQGLTEDQFHEQMGVAAEARWAERGVSAEEIAERQQLRQQNQAECDGDGEGGGVRYGQNR